MKLQYAGDIRDFWKWRVLRHLEISSHRICWMLTPDDDSSQGADLRHFTDPRYRSLDPELVDALFLLRADGRCRSLAALEDTVQHLLPGASFDVGTVGDDSKVVFFDPDIGLAWAMSTPRGSAKHLFRPTVEATYPNSSVLVFQWVQRPDLIVRARDCLAEWVGTDVFVFEPLVWSNVVFMLAPRADDRFHLAARHKAWTDSTLDESSRGKRKASERFK